MIKRADPALREIDRVLEILAEQRHVLAKLNTDSAQALAPLAKSREHFANFLVASNKLAQATAAHRGALARNLQDFPPFLKQLGPAMEHIGRFAEQTTPVARNLNAAAPAIDRIFTQLPGFANSSTTYFESLGKTAKLTGPALTAIRPLLARLQALGNASQPAASNLASLLTSLKESGGLERILDFIFLGTGASNGYDALGHYLRGEAVPAGTCLSYSLKTRMQPQILPTPGSTSATAARASGTSLVMARTLAVLKARRPHRRSSNTRARSPLLPRRPRPEEAQARRSPWVARRQAPPTTRRPPEGSEAGGLLLNYLLGN